LTAVELASLAMLLIFAGFILIALALLSSAGGRAAGGGVVLLGPLPIVFGSSVKMAKIALLLLLALLAIFLALHWML
jgi:uncharacterized membrane protein